MGKKYDVVARIGEYQDRNTGETRPRWKNVGAIIQTDNGHCLLLDKTFNPAGMAQPDRESIILSLFEPRQQQQDQQQATAGQYQQASNGGSGGGYQQPPPPNSGFDDDLDGDIPF